MTCGVAVLLLRLNFSTAWSTNTVSICQSAGLTNVTRVELSRRFLIKVYKHTHTLTFLVNWLRIRYHLHGPPSDETCFLPLQPKNGESLTELGGDVQKLIECLYDSMTECIYQRPITSFTVDVKPQPVFEVDILGKGRAALEAANDDLGETLVPLFNLCSLSLSSFLTEV